jgi:putative glutamine amidotransferase
MTPRPAIGLTIGYSDDREIFALRDDYVRAVEAAGGLPLVFAPGKAADAADLLDHVQGLLLTGGADVEPARYGDAPHPALGTVVRERDAFELALCRTALHRDLPILAICRGHQVLNVATGGTLVQDIPSEVQGFVDHDPDLDRWQTAHDVRILPGTRLRALLNTDTLAVNSFHHQAVRRLGQDLVVSAVSSSDGVVEAVEMPGRRLVIGVQWHPESFWDRGGEFRPLFEALVEAAREGPSRPGRVATRP